jgi:hypothetical protein
LLINSEVLSTVQQRYPAKEVMAVDGNVMLLKPNLEFYMSPHLIKSSQPSGSVTGRSSQVFGIHKESEDVDRTLMNISVLIKKIKIDRAKRTIFSKTNTMNEDFNNLNSTSVHFKDSSVLVSD